MSHLLSVGCWPGSNPSNKYVSRFRESLAAVGIATVDIKHPWDALDKQIDLLHIHWPEQVFWNDRKRIAGGLRAVAALAALGILRMRGVKIVWCVHNLEPHDAGPRLLQFWEFYARCITHLVDGFVTLSPSTIDIARARFSTLVKKPATFVWHPTYLVDLSKVKKLEWRQRHGIDCSAKVLAFFGAVRPYKGVDNLVTSFIETKDRNLRLVVAGYTENNLRNLLESAAGQDDRIMLDLRRLPERELSELVSSADIIVLPFKKTLHTGSIIYALSCGKAVITPAGAYANDLQNQVGPQWIKTYEPPLSPAHLSLLSVLPEGRPNLKFLSLCASGSKLNEFYRMLQNKVSTSCGDRLERSTKS